jgi:hypothetical protein
MNLKTHPFPAMRKTFLEHAHIPAFKAGYLALAIVIAALLNLGVFALLLLLNIGLDFWKYRSGRGLRLRLALRATLRENLFDVALFCMALLASLTLHYGQVVVIVSGLLRYQESLVRGLLLICAKSHLLFRTIERFEKGCMTQKLNGASIVKPWSVPEMLALSCVTLSLMLPLALLLLPPDVSVLPATLTTILTPWKL